MKALVEVVGSAHEPDTALGRILEVVCGLMQADDGSIGLVNRERSEVTIRATHRMPASELGSVSRRGEGLAGTVLSRNSPVRLGRYAELDNVLRPDLGENAVLGVPVVWKGHTVGFFGLGRRPPKQFDESDEALLLRFAAYAAIVIHEARARAETRLLVEELDRLWRLGQDLSSCTSIEETIEAFLNLVAGSGRFVCSVALHEPDAPGTITIVGRWNPAQGADLTPQSLPDTPGMLDADLDRGRPVRIEDVHHDPRCSTELREIQQDTGRSALALFPLMAGLRRIGTVALSTNGPYAWSDDDLRPYATAVSMLGTAVSARQGQEQRTASERRLAQVEVRQRLARELHDSVCQSLFAISLVAQSIDAPGQGDTDTLVRLSREALSDMRHLVRELRPSEGSKPDEHLSFARLRAEGFAACLKGQVDALRASGHEVSLSLDADLPQPLQHEWPLYCATLEAMGNAVRHAQAASVQVAVSTEDGLVRVQVEDDGRGFAVSVGESSGGLGLSSMRDRVESAGGKFQLTSRLGQGTTVLLEVPNA